MCKDNPYENLIGKPTSKEKVEEVATELTNFFQLLMEIDIHNKQSHEK